MGFNKDSISKNIAKASSISSFCNILNTIFGLVYRSIFLRILSINYLGVSGLFDNVLGLLTLADLGISSVIVYRFYRPIANDDSYNVGRLMNFYKKVYRIIALVILAVGLVLCPFLKLLIKDYSEVPSDINIYIVYLLSLIQTLSTYLFSYRQSLLSADQRQYKLSIYVTAVSFVTMVAKIVVLLLWESYMGTMYVTIAITIITNVILNCLIKNRYKEVFEVCDGLSREEEKDIINDTKATLLHKIGGTILVSTDNLVISRFVGVVATGIHSNYLVIINGATKIIQQLFGNFNSSLGKIHVTKGSDENFELYKIINFINFWIVGLVTSCIYILINSFIYIWLKDSENVYNEYTVMLICLQFFLELIRYTTSSYINASGLFVKDRYRPLIEASINIVISVVLAKRIGIQGVVLGTIISHMVTVTWREPYILFKYEFKKSTKYYWMIFTKCFLVIIISSLISFGIKNIIGSIVSIAEWILMGVICAFIYNCTFIIVFRKSEELKNVILNLKNISLNKK